MAKTRTDVLVTVGVFIGIVAFLFLSALSGAKQMAESINCVQHLKTIGLASRIWMGDNEDKYPMQVSLTNGGTMEIVERAGAFLHFRALSSVDFLSTNPAVLVCPADARAAALSWTNGFGNQNLSYFINLDVKEESAPTVLAGDRNLTVNNSQVPSGVFQLRTNTSVGWNKRVHDKYGQLVFADGHAEAYKTNLQPFFQAAGLPTNRLAIP